MPCALTAKIVASTKKHKQSSALSAADAIKKRRTDAPRNCFVTDFHNMQIGQAKRSQILLGIVRSLSWHNVVPVLPVLHREEEYDISKCYLKQIFCTSDENQLICRWCLQSRVDEYLFGSSSSVLQRLEINDDPKASNNCTTLQCLPVGVQHNMNQFKGIMTACVAQTDMLACCQESPVLYAAAVQRQRFMLDTVAVLDSLDSNSFDQPQTPSSFRKFRVGKKWVWSCAWSPGLNNHFAIGTEQLAFLFDANTGTRFALDTQSSDVLAQVFTSAVSVGLFLFSKTRFVKHQIYVTGRLTGVYVITNGQVVNFEILKITLVLHDVM